MTTPGRLCCRRPNTTLAGIDFAALLNAGAAVPRRIPFAAAKRLFLIATRARLCVRVRVCPSVRPCVCGFDRCITRRLTGGTRDQGLGSYVFYYARNQSRVAAAEHANTVIVYAIRTPPNRARPPSSSVGESLLRPPPPPPPVTPSRRHR